MQLKFQVDDVPVTFTRSSWTGEPRSVIGGKRFRCKVRGNHPLT